MIEKKPLLTICVPTYNSEKFLEKSLKSIVNQDYSNFEILVSDNGSTDRTEQIVKSLKSPKIFFRKNIQNPNSNTKIIRVFNNWNSCLTSGLIKSDFVAFYHSDDLLESSIARKEMEFLIENPGVGAVFTMGRIIDENDKIIKKFIMPKDIEEKNIFNFMEIFETILKHGNIFLLTPTFMARTHIFKEVGLFNEKDFEVSGDLEMWLRISQKYPIGIINEGLLNYRVGGMSKKYNNLRTIRADYFDVMDRFLNNRTLFNKINKKLLLQYEYQKDFDDTLRAMNFLMKNEIAEAKKLINHSFSFNVFRAFFENIKIIRIKVMALKILLWIGINAGFGKTLGKILYKKIS